ncbi:sensor histidine kinase [Catenuloplanes atrovinosus]|uniref:histidine kinase n=1 Tax=Catenuloplanes atrovinosus TaxID=137266 RepID=A0AAE3YTS0_9ACTN|nr:histidine kinase [Catenuloplanes atrovinosus]MDR7278506.1 signal transduction histidine kinase [Catenuloplanes atrovinosus]
MRIWSAIAGSARLVWGLAVGALTAVATLAGLAAGGVVLAPALAWPSAREASMHRLTRTVLWLAEFERGRLYRLFGDTEAKTYRGYGPERALAYLGVRWPVGLLGGGILLLFVWGAGTVTVFVWYWLTGRYPDNIPPSPWIITYLTVACGFALFLGVQGLIGVVRLERNVARRFLGPTPADLLRLRIEQLAATRADVVAAVDAERRRIERDLHDGVQQRLVALGMLLGRARRSGAAGDEAKSADLLAQAHTESREILDELREVAWRVYPAALDTLGLKDALAGVAERAPIPVTVRYDVPGVPPAPVVTAAYFVISEAVTNAVKHASASRVEIVVTRERKTMTVRVTDDGAGGADLGGAGLTGLARRVAALDGRFTVISPVGGPTEVRAVLPCG